MSELTLRERTDIALVLDEIKKRREQAETVRSANGSSIGEVQAQDLRRRAMAIERCLRLAYPHDWNPQQPEAS